MIDFYILNASYHHTLGNLLWHVCNIAFHAFDDPEKKMRMKTKAIFILS